MTITLNRRGFLTATAALAASTAFPFASQGQEPVRRLVASTRTIEVNGKTASVYGISGPDGRQGLTLDPGERFALTLENSLDVETIIHWHGQLPPNAQDGVPDMPMPKLASGEIRSYDFEPLAGTHWMHSHVPIQEMNLLAAPLIVRSVEDVAEDRQEVVMFLHDFSFKNPETILEEITSGTGHGDMSHGSSMPMDHGGMDMERMDMSDMESMSTMAMDLNDFDFDAYLVNDRTLDDPELVHVERRGRVKLRIINGSSATSFWIDTGVDGRLVAVDGHKVAPITGRRFGLAMGQRLDIDLDLPTESRAFPILALREGERERTGLILAPRGAAVPTMSGMSDTAAPAFDVDFSQEAALQALDPLPERTVSNSRMVMLEGTMSPYVWTIDGRGWGEHEPIVAKSGERVELTFHNMSMMGHPMHLHGHAFQVVGHGSRRFWGAVRDTVYVPPMASVTIAIDAGEAARWMLHCHHMPHLSTGMMTEFRVET
ncbi:multicopper oxidase domain-containing protein (plasmid) [Martelella lutilitoris]|uniref:Copper resistance protein A n=2 Tax=Martelella TaxID=293088 RepID=A0A1U9Z9K6_9HYPH|nr:MULTISPECIES: multicopper oxidase domain-containing protein [Martelella]AQZ54346.1 Copper resistance protein A precursor [Martelella mediterranea DSM 17316]QQM32842.1 multicopper oxidase domain-containing protein [Martelella lutilitoris]QRX65063.1 multicopper oxidase domain-containing protein [Dysgonomonadaceae bacterium zrk40]